MDQYAAGHGLDPAASFGALNNEAQHKKVLNLLNLLDRTRGSAADLLQLGRKLDPGGWENGYYVLPHVVRDAEHPAPISCQEQFGPLVPLIPYDSEELMLSWANDGEHGLGSSVWTSDPDRGLALARRVEAGSTFVNSHSLQSLDLRMPFGGVKQSGIGREFGTAGLAAYVEEHSIRHVKRSTFRPLWIFVVPARLGARGSSLQPAHSSATEQPEAVGELALLTYRCCSDIAGRRSDTPDREFGHHIRSRRADLEVAIGPPPFAADKAIRAAERLNPPLPSKAKRRGFDDRAPGEECAIRRSGA